MSRIDDAIKEMEENIIEKECTTEETFWNEGIKRGIDILKKHKKKKCVWKKDGDVYYNRHNDIAFFGKKGMSYCMYCGRKIKVKESE